MTDLSGLDATDQAALVRSGEAQPLELVDAAITRIEKLNDDLNAVIHPLFDRARAAASAELPAGGGPSDHPFAGVPIVVKDLDGTLAGAPYHGGNRLLKEINYTPTVTCHLFAKLEAAGFVIVGKTNTPEFGLIPSTEPLVYGPSHNPWNVAHSPGGSSGGSAAAVASGMVPVAHAGDGGGSIRIPASACGLFGLKPSRGRISLGPAEAEAWAGLVMRHVVSRSVRDSAAILDLLEGYMSGDPYTAPPPRRPYASEVGADPGSLRIGVSKEAPSGLAETHPECIAAVDDAIELLTSLGHTVIDAAPAALAEDGLMDQFSAVMMSCLRADVDEIGEIAGRPITADDVEPLTWLYYEGSNGIDGGAYVRAVADMQAWTRRVVSWWTDDNFDLLLTPTLAEPPPVLGDVGRQDDGGLNAAARSLPFAAYTAPFNVTGQPAMSVPLYWSAAGLPIGVQLVGAHFREDLLIRVAAQLEQARPWRRAARPFTPERLGKAAMTDPAQLDATAEADLVRRGVVSPLELVDAAINNIEKLNPELNAVIHPLFDSARAAARGDLPDGPFRGVPILFKDLFCAVEGDPLNEGMPFLKNAAWHSDHTDAIAHRYLDAGFVCVGRTNTPELGLVPTTEPEAHGPTRNPWDTTRTPGGSSGGSAAAVASRMVAVVHANDGGGSIRIPASCCGLVGLKPSRGRVSLGPDYSAIDDMLVSELCVSRSVRDTAGVLDVLHGRAVGDTVSAPAPVRPFAHEVGADPGRLRIGLLTSNPFGTGAIHADCVAAARDAAQLLESLGHTVEEAFPAAIANPELVRHFTTLWAVTLVYNLRYFERKVGREVTANDVEALTWSLAELGRKIPAPDYVDAQHVMGDLACDIDGWFGSGFDLLLTPTIGEPPVKLGEFTTPENPLQGFARAATFVPYTPTANMAGTPAISLPLTWNDQGLPIGTHLMAAYGREDLLLRVASQLETARPWADRLPPVHA